MLNALTHCVMLLWFLVPFCSVPLFFGRAFTLDLQFFPPNIYAILIDNDCVCYVRLSTSVKQCLAAIQLCPLAKFMISNSPFDIIVNEMEELLSVIVGKGSYSMICPRQS
jgi:hypothetical protein